MRLLLLVCSCLLGGCAAGGMAEADAPRFRLGSMPFPGFMTLYVAVDPHDLGKHRTASTVLPFGDQSEKASRGIMYTCRAGFLDLSHMRETIDWARFVHHRARQALDSGEPFAFECFDARFDVHVLRPSWWNDLNGGDRLRMAQELSARFAARTAMNLGTWHEVATWLGYQTIPGISETRSAFTWDDTSSHIIAANVAEKALRSPLPFDDAVTLELDRAISSLSPVSKEQERQAVAAVDGIWYRDGAPLRRDLDIGLRTGVKYPWVIAGVDCNDDQAGRFDLPLPAPLLDNGLSIAQVFDIKITPRPWLVRRKQGVSAGMQPQSLEPYLVESIEWIRAELHAEYGPLADSPLHEEPDRAASPENGARSLFQAVMVQESRQVK